MNSIEETCPKCGEEMYARCEPDHEGGCFYETAEDEEIESAIRFCLADKTRRPTKRNPIPLMLKKNKTREENIALLRILEDVEDEDEEMPELIPISAQ